MGEILIVNKLIFKLTYSNYLFVFIFMNSSTSNNSTQKIGQLLNEKAKHRGLVISRVRVVCKINRSKIKKARKEIRDVIAAVGKLLILVDQLVCLIIKMQLCSAVILRFKVEFYQDDLIV